MTKIARINQNYAAEGFPWTVLGHAEVHPTAEDAIESARLLGYTHADFFDSLSVDGTDPSFGPAAGTRRIKITKGE